MIVFPAIDIRDGKCVRLLKGDFEQETVYGSDPVEMAKRIIDAGAEWIHVVDLDGARSGEGKNFAAVEKIAALDIKIQLGGGIRTMKDIKRRFECGISRVILGTAAIETPELIGISATQYGDAIAVGIDEKDGLVAVRGWETTSVVLPLELAKSMREKGVKYIIHTDITRDGMKTGPNIAASAEMAEKAGVNVIVSGGVGSIADIIAAKERGLYGIIMGKAFYDGNIDLKQALEVAK